LRRAGADRFGIAALAPKPPPRKRPALDLTETRRALAELAELRAFKQLIVDIQLELRIAAYPNRLAPARKYNLDQPRVPASNPDSGQRTVDGRCREQLRAPHQ
jgi:hypothetical protein